MTDLLTDFIVPKPWHADLLGKLDNFAKARAVVSHGAKALEQCVIIRIIDSRGARENPTQRPGVLPEPRSDTPGRYRAPRTGR